MSVVIALLPELVLALGGLAVFAALMARADREALARRAAQVVALALVVATAASVTAKGDFLWSSYRVDVFSQVIKLAVALGFALTVFVTRDAPGQRDDARGEVFFFLLTSTAGLMLMASAVEAVALYIALEIASFSLFVLVPLREGFAPGKEAGLKFLIVGLGASAVTLFGLSLLVGLTGTTFLPAMGSSLTLGAGEATTVLALALFTAGFLFKLALFPFHFWAPDVYQGASNGVATFVATASKVAAVAVLARLLAVGGFALAPVAAALALAAAISMTLGNLVAIVQRDVKRMLAYSAVAQAGYIAVGLVAFSVDGLAAAIQYAILYLLMNAAAFLVVARIAPDGSNPTLDDLRGLWRRAPILAGTLLLALFALAGVPPTAGFVGKWMLFRAAIERGWWWLVLLGAANSTLSVYYYLVAVKHAYLLPPEEGKEERAVPLTAGDRALCYVLSAALVVLGVWPTGLLQWSERAAFALLH